MLWSVHGKYEHGSMLDSCMTIGVVTKGYIPATNEMSSAVCCKVGRQKCQPQSATMWTVTVFHCATLCMEAHDAISASPVAGMKHVANAVAQWYNTHHADWLCQVGPHLLHEAGW